MDDVSTDYIISLGRAPVCADNARTKLLAVSVASMIEVIDAEIAWQKKASLEV